MSSIDIGEIGMIRDSRRLEMGDFCTIDVATVLGRQQPVVCNLQAIQGYDFRVLSLKTPLGTTHNLSLLEQRYSMFGFAYENDFLTVRLCYDAEADAEDLHGVYMRVDLPVLSDDEGGENSLSAYELNESLNLLVECADMTERLVFYQQDIDLKSTRIDSSQISKTNNTLHRTVSTVALSGQWQRAWNGNYIQLSKKFDKTLSNSDLWTLNHRTPFIKFLAANQKTEVLLSYLSKDIQEKELNALERYFLNQFIVHSS